MSSFVSVTTLSKVTRMPETQHRKIMAVVPRRLSPPVAFPSSSELQSLQVSSRGRCCSRSGRWSCSLRGRGRPCRWGRRTPRTRPVLGPATARRRPAGGCRAGWRWRLKVSVGIRRAGNGWNDIGRGVLDWDAWCKHDVTAGVQLIRRPRGTQSRHSIALIWRTKLTILDSLTRQGWLKQMVMVWILTRGFYRGLDNCLMMMIKICSCSEMFGMKNIEGLNQKGSPLPLWTPAGDPSARSPPAGPSRRSLPRPLEPPWTGFLSGTRAWGDKNLEVSGSCNDGLRAGN